MVEINKILGSIFHDDAVSFTITVHQADQALRGYAEVIDMPRVQLLAITNRQEYANAERGIMAAALARAIGWDADKGRDEMLHNGEFQALIEGMVQLYQQLMREGLLWPSITARLS